MYKKNNRKRIIHKIPIQNNSPSAQPLSQDYGVRNKEKQVVNYVKRREVALGVERYSGRQLESEQHEQKSPCNFQYDPTNKILSPETHDERECKSE